METATLSSKGQLVIPARVRKAAHAVSGDVFQVHYVNGEIRLSPMPQNATTTVDHVAGLLSGAARTPRSDAQAHAAIKARLKAQDLATRSAA
jgi:AbrB family looped-hinge helix DNA binding protein